MVTENPRDQDASRAEGDAFDFRPDLAKQRAMLRQRLAKAEKLTAAHVSHDQKIGIAAFAGYTLGPMLLARAKKRRRRSGNDS